MEIDDQLHLLKKIKAVEPPANLLPGIKYRLKLHESNQISMTWSWTIAAAALLILCINIGILMNYQHKDNPPKVEQLASSMHLSNSNDLYYE